MENSVNKQSSLEENHAHMVLHLCKKGEDIQATLNPEKVHLWHMASKLCSEAGELMDAVAKLVIYNKELDIVNVIEELGDIEFYMQGIRQCILSQTTREETLRANITKLAVRYKDFNYSDKQAQDRADKQ